MVVVGAPKPMIFWNFWAGSNVTVVTGVLLLVVRGMVYFAHLSLKRKVLFCYCYTTGTHEHTQTHLSRNTHNRQRKKENDNKTYWLSRVVWMTVTVCTLGVEAGFASVEKAAFPRAPASFADPPGEASTNNAFLTPIVLLLSGECV